MRLHVAAYVSSRWLQHQTLLECLFMLVQYLSEALKPFKLLLLTYQLIELDFINLSFTTWITAFFNTSVLFVDGFKVGSHLVIEKDERD